MSITLVTLVLSAGLQAQNNLAAVLEVLNAGVQVQRVNTANPITVNQEAIVGVGDTIFTDETGRARITFFEDGVSTELEPATTYRIERFEGDDETFSLRASVLAGQTLQQIGRALDPSSSYEIDTPGMTLAARGTAFAIRVEDSGRAAMLVTEGNVEAAAEDATADVPMDFGIRSATNNPLSDVVRASTFAQLDAALDGCTLSVTTPDDVRLNVRVGPNLDAPRVGTVAARDIGTVIGRNESEGWYRFDFRGGFGWFLSSTAEIVGDCAGLRIFPDNFRENPDLYEVIGDPIELDAGALATPTPEVTPEAEPDDNADS